MCEMIFEDVEGLWDPYQANGCEKKSFWFHVLDISEVLKEFRGILFINQFVIVIVA